MKKADKDYYLHIEIAIDHLKKHGENIIYKGSDFTTLFFAEAVERKDLSSIKRFCEAGYDLNTITETDYGGKFFIFQLSKIIDDYSIFAILAEYIKHLDAESSDGHTALMLSEDKNVVKYLIENGCDVNKKTSKNLTPLFFAVIKDDLQKAKLLLENDADVNVICDKDEPTTALYLAESKEMVSLLLEYGAIDYHDKWNQFNRFAKACASSNDDETEIIALLKDQHDIDEIYIEFDKILTCPLNIAVSYDNVNTVEYLLALGANVNNPRTWFSPIQIVSRDNSLNSLKLLLQSGALIDDLRREVSPLYLASYNGNKEIVEILLQNGADVSIQNDEGKTAYDIALEKGHIEILKLLKDASLTNSPQSNQNNSPATQNAQLINFSNNDLLRGNTALTKIILRYDKTIFLEENKQRFLGLVSDYLEKNRDFAQILKQIINTDILQKLYEADSLEDSEKINAIKYATEEIKNALSIQPNQALSLIKIFTNALDWEVEF